MNEFWRDHAAASPLCIQTRELRGGGTSQAQPIQSSPSPGPDLPRGNTSRHETGRHRPHITSEALGPRTCYTGVLQVRLLYNALQTGAEGSPFTRGRLALELESGSPAAPGPKANKRPAQPLSLALHRKGHSSTDT